jgi:hypothetical protein
MASIATARSWTRKSPCPTRARQVCTMRKLRSNPTTCAPQRTISLAHKPGRTPRPERAAAPALAGCGVCGDLGMRKRSLRHQIPSLPAVCAGEREGRCLGIEWSGAGSKHRPSAFQERDGGGASSRRRPAIGRRPDGVLGEPSMCRRSLNLLARLTSSARPRRRRSRWLGPRNSNRAGSCSRTRGTCRSAACNRTRSRWCRP